MKNILYRWILIIVIISMAVLSIAQERGGSGGSSNHQGSVTNKALEVKSFQPLSKKQTSTAIEIGTPQIGIEDGIYIWLDEYKTWQIRWKGEKGQLVWVRLKGENHFIDITTGEKISTEMRGEMALTITGTTSTEIIGVSFKCETPEIDIDAKWNMMRDISKVYISAQKENLTNLPTVVKVLAFAGAEKADMTTKSIEENLTEQPSSGIAKGHGSQGYVERNK